ncbi:MAG: hypothetical protein Q7W56_01220 [Candidatus Latescibacteria bacterium]|nr:hypothetical protein [Candidatus Latescibacterota bacterium]
MAHPIPPRRGSSRAIRTCGLLAALFGCLVPVAARSSAWLVPAGGETWTAGTSHTLVWSGGTATVFGLGAYELPSNAFTPISPAFPNTGYYTWTIPANLPPGTYKLGIGFVEGDYIETAPFTIQAPPECLQSCHLATASTLPSSPWSNQYPETLCASTPEQAVAFAQAFLTSKLEEQCLEGYSINPGSVVIDVTLLPVGYCYVGYFGFYQAAASGFACCCQDPVAGESGSWGEIKAQYR